MTNLVRKRLVPRDPTRDVRGAIQDIAQWANDPDTFGTEVTLTAGTIGGFRNALLNGQFNVWQRGAGPFTASGVYTADRWQTAHTGTTRSLTRQAFALGNVIPGQEPEYYLRDVVTSVAGVGNRALIEHHIEDVRTFAGQTVTVSFYAKADAAKNIAIEMTQNFGSGGAPSAQVNEIGSRLFALTTSWQRYSATIEVPSIAGKTLGTGLDSSVRLLIWMDAGTNFAARSANLGQQSGTFDYWGVQVEPGTVLTALERRPVGVETMLCQRFYWRPADGGSNNQVFCDGQASSVTRVQSRIRPPVTMRAIPSVAFSGAVRVNDGVTATAITAFSISSPDLFFGQFDVAAGLTQFRPYWVARNADVAAYIEFGADI